MFEILQRWFELTVDVSLKVLLLAAATGLLLRMLRIRNSSVKYAAWFGALGSLLILPLLSPVIPSIPIPWPTQVLKEASTAAPAALVESPKPSAPSVDRAVVADAEPSSIQQTTALQELTSDRMQSVLREAADLDATTQMPQVDSSPTSTIESTDSSSPQPAVVPYEFHFEFWLKAAALIWCVGLIFQVTRLVVSVMLTDRLVRRSLHLDIATLSNRIASPEVDEYLTPELLRESTLIYVPLTAGCMNPRVLLPASWRDWSAEKLGHVLVHESTHVRRNDCWSMLLAEIVVCLYWFHPVAWWIKRRLAVLAEECCDDAAISVMGSRTTYARHLLEIASTLRERSHRLNYAGLAMARRSQIEHRILTILDTDRPLSKRLTWYSALLIVAILAPLMAVTAALRPATVENKVQQQEQAESKSGSESGSDPTGAVDSQELVDISEGYRVEGQVLDPEGRPLAGVTVSIRRQKLLPRTKTFAATSKELASVKTDSSGHYNYLIPASDLPAAFHGWFDHANDWIQLAVKHPGYGVETANFAIYEPQQKFDLRLVPDRTIRGRILDLEGRPVAGVDVRVRELIRTSAEQIDNWYGIVSQQQDRILDEQKMRQQRMSERPAPEAEKAMAEAVFYKGPTHNLRVLMSDFDSIKTDSAGRFELSGLGADRLAVLELAEPTHVRNLVNVVTRPIKTVRDFYRWNIQTYNGSEFEYVLSPSPFVEGVVRDQQTGRPLPGTLVTIDSPVAGADVYHPGNERQGYPEQIISSVTDVAGHYRLEGVVPNGDQKLKIFPPEHEPYQVTGEIKIPDSPNLQSVVINVDLPKSVWVTGRVYNIKTNEPVVASLSYSPFMTNPNVNQYPQFTTDIRYAPGFNTDRLYQTDKEGRFRIPVIPGRGVIAANVQGEGYLAGYGKKAIAEFASMTSERRNRRDETTFDEILPFNFHSLKEVSPSADQESIEIELPVDPGISVRFSFIDPDGNPLQNVRVVFYDKIGGNKPIASSSSFVASGFIEGQPALVGFNYYSDIAGQSSYQTRKTLRKVQSINVANEEQQFTIQLEQEGTIRGRLVDQSGKPWPVRRISYTLITDAGKTYGPYSGAGSQPFPDRSFELNVETGCRCRISASGDETVNYREIVLPEEILPKAGAVINLGNIVVMNDGKVKLESRAEQPVPGSNMTRFEGRVVGSDGQPVAGANVSITKWVENDRPMGNREIIVDGETDRDGRYKLIAPRMTLPSSSHPMIIVRAANRALAWKKVDLSQAESHADFQLAAEAKIQFRLIDLEGNPLAGVTPTSITINDKARLQDPDGHLWVFDNSKSNQKSLFPRLSSDQDGLLTIPHVTSDYMLYVDLEGSDRIAPQSLILNSGLPEIRPKNDGTYRGIIKEIKPGECPNIPLAPARFFEGVVKLGNSELPAANARITIWASEQEYGSMVTVESKTDSEGRFRLNPQPGIRFGIHAYPPKGSAYMIKNLDRLKWESVETSKNIVIRLPAGITIRGSVIDAETGKPIPKSAVQYYPNEKTNKNLPQGIITQWQGMVYTDEEGFYEIPVAAGPGTLLVHAPADSSYVLQQKSSREVEIGGFGGTRLYAHAFVSIDPPALQGDQGELRPIEPTRLQPGGIVKAEVVDTAGRPVEHALYISRLRIVSHSPEWRAFPATTENGIAEFRGLEPGVKYQAFFLDTKNQIGATAEISTDELNPKVILKPCATAKMRFVDGLGKPLKKGTLMGLNMVVTPGPTKFSSDVSKLGMIAADEDFTTNFDQMRDDDRGIKEDGIAEVGYLIPGTTYRFIKFGAKPAAEKEFVAESGKQHDLGEIVIEN